MEGIGDRTINQDIRDCGTQTAVHPSGEQSAGRSSPESAGERSRMRRNCRHAPQRAGTRDSRPAGRPGQKEPEPRNRTDRTRTETERTGTERTVIEFGSSS